MDKGLLSGIGAYFFWGFFPIYFKLLESVPAFQIVAHRLLWSFLFFALIVAIRRDWAGIKAGFHPKILLITVAAGLILTVNWLIYIWGVNSGYILETSLGYFINPLVNVLLGVVFFREKLPVSKWTPVGLATIGVLYLTISYGRLPWIALGLAFSFGLYGLLKKLTPLNSLHSLSVETMVLFVPALVYLIYVERQAAGSFLHATASINILLIMAGFVTAIPLLLFSTAAHSISLSTLGLLQYIAPTLQFLIGIVVFHESFTQEKLIGFGIIWCALIIYTISSVKERRKARSIDETTLIEV